MAIPPPMKRRVMPQTVDDKYQGRSFQFISWRAFLCLVLMLTVEALMDLRKRVDQALHERRAELQMQLERMAVVGGARVVQGGGSALRGRKVPPKYRSPSGETWAGRGARPRWLVAAIKRGKKLEDFLIGKGRRKRRSKR